MQKPQEDSTMMVRAELPGIDGALDVRAGNLGPAKSRCRTGPEPVDPIGT
ncbi:MAG TPA: hypothetical protein VK903_02355 [Propionicimonas sp.]|nr:hypothetical protein [Propionicimonas sp.]